jgi:hypothetical protein
LNFAENRKLKTGPQNYHKTSPGKKCYCGSLIVPLPSAPLALHSSLFALSVPPSPALLLNFLLSRASVWHHLAPPRAVLSATRAGPSRLTPKISTDCAPARQAANKEPRRSEARRKDAKRGEQNVWREDGPDAPKDDGLLYYLQQIPFASVFAPSLLRGSLSFWG